MKLLATIRKDIRILTRDRTGLMLMLLMPIILVVVVTIIQNNTFDLLSKNNKVGILISNQDGGRFGKELVDAVDSMGMFRLDAIEGRPGITKISEQMRSHKVVAAILVPDGFSAQLSYTAKTVSGRALHSFGLDADSVSTQLPAHSDVTLLFLPEIEPSLKLSMEGSLNSALQMVQSRQVLKNIYSSINEKAMPDSLEKQLTGNRMGIDEISVGKNRSAGLPNATQHNIPAWTIFAMFFVVMSLGGSVVREKTSGSFIRLKTLPTSFAVAILSKQITFLLVTLFQAAVIFAIGLFLFPVLGLPPLNLPQEKTGLVLVTLICGWCAVSYALCIGILAKTQNQANGFGAISIVILAVIGGLMIPSFAMPASFSIITRLSPLHWCLQSYYDLFLEGGKLSDVWANVLPLIGITLLLQLIIFAALKKKNLI